MGIDRNDTTITTIFREIDEINRSFRLNPHPEHAKEIKKIIELINPYNNALNWRLITNLIVEHKIRFSIEEISQLNPFHWRLKFTEMFRMKEGFDVIMGNPPYVGRSKLNYPTALFNTNDCGNTICILL